MLPLDWVISVVTVLTLLYIYYTWNNNYWEKRGIPFVKPQFFFGNFKKVFFVQKTVGEITEELYWKLDGHSCGGVFRFRTPAILVRDPELIKTILVKEFNSFYKNGLAVDPNLDPLVSKSPFFLSGEKWKKVRSILTPSFTSVKLRPLHSLMEQVSQEMVQYIQNTIPDSRPDGMEVKEMSSKYTTEVVASCAFGIVGGCFKNPNAEMRVMGRKIIQPDFVRNVQVLLTLYAPFLGSLLKFRFLPVEVAKFFSQIVDEAMAFRKTNNISRNDYLQLLIQIQKKSQAVFEEKIAEGEQAVLEYTSQDVASHAAIFMVEGFETSSVAMSLMLYELAVNSEVQQKLREELETAMQENNGQLNYDIIQNLPYLDMVLTETLRMYPPLMTMEKYCTKTCDLQTPSGGTYRIEKGTLILIPVYAIQRDPKYFPEPDKFDPERFSEERKGSIPRYAYLPFGEGPRVCIGMRFAQMQIKVGVTALVLNYDVKKTPRTPVPIVLDANSFIPAAKGGLWLDFVKRKLK